LSAQQTIEEYIGVGLSLHRKDMVIYLSKNRWSDKDRSIAGEEDNRH